MTDAPNPGAKTRTPTKASRTLRIALAASVALNLAVAGLVGGVWLKAGGEPRVPVRELGFGPFTEALTREQRGELRRAFIERGPGMRGLRNEMREDADAILGTLRADPFAPARFAEGLERMNQRMAGRTRDSEAILVHVVAGMSPAERAGFADRLQAAMERGRQPHKPDRPDPQAGNN